MKKLSLFVLVTLIIFFGYEGYKYLHFRTTHAVSDAGFIKSDSLSIVNFKVGGKIETLYKKEGQSVKKGELLASIDKKDFLVAKSKIQNNLQSITKEIESLKIKKEIVSNEVNISKRVAKNSINAFNKKVFALKYQIKANEDKLKEIEKNVKRFKRLLNQKLVSKNRYEKLASSRDSLTNSINAQKKELQSLLESLKNVKEKLNLAINQEKSIKEIQTKIDSLNYKKDALSDSLKEINNKISYCDIHAPFDGIIAKKFVNSKRVVEAGYPIYALVDPKDIHIEVLLSEKKLFGVKKGCEVEFRVDAIKDKKFKGVVQGILPASASTFSLVPRDIASGEFTKLDQRFVVRIDLNQVDKSLMRVGMSVNVAIKRDSKN